MLTVPDKEDIVPLFPPELQDREFTDKFIGTMILRAVNKIQIRAGTLVEQRIASGTVTNALYVSVVAGMVARALLNTGGLRQEQDGNYQYEIDLTVASGKIQFTDDDREDLCGVFTTQSFIGTAHIGMGSDWT